MSDHGRVIECARKVTQRCERQGSCECSLLRKTVLMLWAFWMDKNTSHCPTPPHFPKKSPWKAPKSPQNKTKNPQGCKEYKECVVMVWEEKSGKQVEVNHQWMKIRYLLWTVRAKLKSFVENKEKIFLNLLTNKWELSVSLDQNRRKAGYEKSSGN